MSVVFRKVYVDGCVSQDSGGKPDPSPVRCLSFVGNLDGSSSWQNSEAPAASGGRTRGRYAV